MRKRLIVVGLIQKNQCNLVFRDVTCSSSTNKAKELRKRDETHERYKTLSISLNFHKQSMADHCKLEAALDCRNSVRFMRFNVAILACSMLYQYVNSILYEHTINLR